MTPGRISRRRGGRSWDETGLASGRPGEGVTLREGAQELQQPARRRDAWVPGRAVEHTIRPRGGAV